MVVVPESTSKKWLLVIDRATYQPIILNLFLKWKERQFPDLNLNFTPGLLIYNEFT